VIIVYKVINMDIFHTKSIGLSELLSRMDYFYDGWMHFFGLSQVPFSPIIKLGGARIFLNITLIVFG